MNEIELFTNDEFNLEYIPDGDGFSVVASGLARALGFRDAFNLTVSIPDEEKGYTLVSTPGGEQRILALTESGFYRALGQRQVARIPNKDVRAKVARFQSWVYREVLPSLRRASTQTPTTPLKIDATVAALAELAHREHVVPAAGRILAYERWNKPDEGIKVFVQLEINLHPHGLESGPALRELPRDEAA